MTDRFKKEWESYSTDVLSPDAGETQHTECRRAFYAGAWALWQLVLKASEDGGEPTAQDEQMMQEIHDELEQFCSDVGEGRT